MTTIVISFLRPRANEEKLINVIAGTLYRMVQGTKQPYSETTMTHPNKLQTITQTLKKHTHWLVFFVLLTAGFLNFHSSLNGEFMIDDYHIFDYQKKNIKFIFYQLIPDRAQALETGNQPIDSYYRPFTHSLFMVLYWLFRDHTFYYHAFNLFIFTLSAFLAYRLIAFLFSSRLLGFLTALFYLIHPINGIIVNYITAVYFPFQVIFMILSLWCLWRATVPYVRRDARCGVFTFGAVFFFILAMLCHESAMALPFYAVCLLKTVGRQTWKAIFKNLLPFGFVLFAYFLFRMRYASFNASLFSNISHMNMNPGEYLASATKSVVWYLSQLVSPGQVLFANVIPIVRDHVLPWLMVLVGILAIFFILLRVRKLQSSSVLGLQWLAVGFIPFGAACLTIPMFGLLIEPHWFVFSCLGFFLFLSSVLHRFWINRQKNIIWICVPLIVVPWMITSQLYNFYWSSEKTYTHYWVKNVPHFKRINDHLGRAYLNEKNFDLARFYYHEALEGTSSDWQRYANIGSLYLMEGNLKLAKENLLQADRVDPQRGIVLNSLGVIAIKENNLPQAKKYFSRAVTVSRFSVGPRFNLARILLNEGDLKGASDLYRQILTIAPDYEMADVALMRIYAQDNDRSRALAIAQKLFEHSQNPEILAAVGQILGRYDLNELADAAYQKASVARPLAGTKPELLVSGSASQ